MTRTNSPQTQKSGYFSALGLLTLLAVLHPTAQGASQVQVNFESGSQIVFGSLSGALNPGSAADGDGAVIQLGYYAAATIGNNFAGTWHALTGAGSLNIGGDTGSGLTFDTTSIGDIGGGAAPGGSGIFAFSLVFDNTVSGTFADLPGSITIPLAIKFFNAPSLGASTYFNVVSADAWLWKLPATPSPLPPTINLSLDDAGLEWQSIAVAGQSPSTAFHASIAIVPEPTATLLIGLGFAAFAMRRNHPNRSGRI